jgi:DNA-directed RNA polymerase subunit F
MNFDLQSLFPDFEALTPDGRWNMLQDWLAKNPEYGERAERWSTQTVDEVFDDLLALASKKHGAIATIAFTLPAIAAKIRSAIEILQTCYRERAGQEQEKKHVRRKRKTIKA